MIKIQEFIIKNCYWFASIILIGTLCFFAGRKTIDTVTKIEYIKGETIYEKIDTAALITSIIPDNPTLPKKKDTIWKPYPVKGDTKYLPSDTINVPYYVNEKVDTSKIIKDYITLNKYKQTLFDNQNGKMIVGASVQYNKLFDIDYEFTPIKEVITKERKRTVTVFGTGSYNTFI